MKSQLGHRSFLAPNTNQRHLFLHTAGTSHRHSKTCPNFSRMPLPQRTAVNLKNLQPLLWWSQQVKWKIRRRKTLLKSKGSTTNRKHRRTTLMSLLRPLDIPEPVARSADRPGLRMQPITANTWPKLASSPSLTFTRLPASEHLHQPSPNQMVTPMQCHSTWPCNNPTGTSLLLPWHGNWVIIRNSSTGRSFTSPKS